MIKSFPNNIISNFFNDIRILLYKADERKDLPPEDLFDFKYVNTSNWKSDNIEDPK